ncbi:hypothetical protein V5F32_00710 [Xanthobacter oligotrophicus]|uniref:Lipoprotein n=1 Tax=Xanthobacter oligotrophicus TaxID=2607286 RepID=A0ABW6ZPN3_9HYPH
MRASHVIGLCLAAFALAGCETTSRPRIALTAVPPDIVECARRRVPAPMGDAALTERDVYRLVAALKGSEEAKSGCLARLIALHEADAAMVVEALR